MRNKKKSDMATIIFGIVLIALAVLVFFAMAYGVMALDKYLQEPKVVMREIKEKL